MTRFIVRQGRSIAGLPTISNSSHDPNNTDNRDDPRGEEGDRSVGIAAAGDVDGDGNRDLLISSVGASPLNRVGAGEVYLIYGRGEQ